MNLQHRFLTKTAFLVFIVLFPARGQSGPLPLPPEAVRPIIPSIGDIPWITPISPTPEVSPASPPPPEDRCVGIVAEFPAEQSAKANTCCHTYLYPDRTGLDVELARSEDYDRFLFACCLNDADASLSEEEKLACQCRVTPAAAMCQCQGSHQADFVNGCLRGVVPEGTPAPQFILDPDGTHYTLTLGRRAPVSLTACACASPQPFTGTGTCGRSPLSMAVYDYPCLYPEQAEALRAETVAEGYRLTDRLSAESCAHFGGVLREPAEGELIPLGEARPCSFLRPQCPCSASSSTEAPSGSTPDAGAVSGDAPPSGSSVPADDPLKEPAPSPVADPASMTDEKKDGGCSVILQKTE